MLVRCAASLMRGVCPAFFLCWIGLSSVTTLAAAESVTASITPARQTELVGLVRNDCGSCHGLTLKGGLGSPLLPEWLMDKPDISLRETILRGRTGTAMPPWSAFLNEAEAEWIVVRLKEGFPNAP